jgi:hypothetical protein
MSTNSFNPVNLHNIENACQWRSADLDYSFRICPAGNLDSPFIT